MVLSAKEKNWECTFSILDKKPHLINGIPEERAWSALHQAVGQGNIDALKKLLAIKNCDINIKAKRNRNNITDPGDTPLKLAHKCDSTECVQLLKDHHCDLDNSSPPTFLQFSGAVSQVNDDMPYFSLGIAFMKREKVESMYLEDCSSFPEIMQAVFGLLKRDWQYAHSATTESLYIHSVRTCIKY